LNNSFIYSDSVLLLQVKEGDEKAFNIIFERYRNRLFSYLVKATKSRESAEEATLDIFLKIWNARYMLDEIVNFEAFLFRVVHNKALDCIRKAKTDRLVQLQLWDELGALASTNTADQKILSAETEAAINAIITSLSPQRQTAFKLSREEWLSYDEIAERMKISRHTVHNHITSALQYIRKNLQKGTEITGILILTEKFF